MRSDQDRIVKYTAKVAPTTVGLKIASRLAGMKTGFAAWCNTYVAKEQQIQGILNGAGVPTIQYPFYINFGREIGKRVYAGLAGDSLQGWATACQKKWTAFGCETVTLKQIALDVFSIDIV